MTITPEFIESLIKKNVAERKRDEFRHERARDHAASFTTVNRTKDPHVNVWYNADANEIIYSHDNRLRYHPIVRGINGKLYVGAIGQKPDKVAFSKISKALLKSVIYQYWVSR